MDYQPRQQNPSKESNTAGSSSEFLTNLAQSPSRQDLAGTMAKAEEVCPLSVHLRWALTESLYFMLSVSYLDALCEFPTWRLQAGSISTMQNIWDIQTSNPDDILIALAKSTTEQKSSFSLEVESASDNEMNRECSSASLEDETTNESIGRYRNTKGNGRTANSDQYCQEEMQSSSNGYSSSSSRSNPISMEFNLDQGDLFADRYRIVNNLGNGGMGKVYQVSDLKLHKDAALKILHPHLIDDEMAKRRFSREAKAALELDHPNLLSGYEFGVSEKEGLPYIVMEIIDGEALSTVLGLDGPLPFELFYDVFSQVCDALAHAHERHLIHRDVKPSNIMLLKTDKQKNIIKLLDFGIAKFITGSLAGADQEVTRGGDVYGSPSYMSPEQCLGVELDYRSDIYSLGCVMFESISGMRAFDSPNPLTIMEMHVSAKPRSFDEICPELAIPGPLEAIIKRCIEKRPEDRYDTTSQIAKELEHFILWCRAKPEQAQIRIAKNASEMIETLELLRTCELISKQEQNYAMRIIEEGKFDVDQYLESKCEIGARTIEAARKCLTAIRGGRFNMELAIIAMHYSQKNNASLDEALEQLGYA